MQKLIGILLMLGIAAFAVFWPMGAAYAVFTTLLGVLHGAWATNCPKLRYCLLFAASAFAMGLLTVLSLVVAMHPGVGTFVFGSGQLSFTLYRYGVAQELVSLAWLSVSIVPGLLGAVLARGVRNRMRRRDTVPGTPDPA